MLFAITGLCYRFQMDDLYYTTRINMLPPYEQLDALGMMRSVYENWNGRYSTIVIQTVLETWEPLTSMLLPGAMMLALTLILRTALLASRYARAAWLAPVWMACWMIAIPGRDFAIFWVSAAVSQYMPVVTAGLAALLILKGRTALWLLPLGLMTGGFSEITAVLLAVLPLLVYRKRGLLYWWAGIGIAIVIMITSPGAAVRLSFGQDWMTTLQRAGTEWLLIPGRVVFLPGLALAFVIGYAYPEKTRRKAVVIVWLTGILFACTAAILAMKGAVLSIWVMAIPAVVLVLAAWLTGCYLNEPGYRRAAKAVLITAVSGVYLVAGLWLIDRVWFVAQWEARDRAIRAGQTVVVIFDERDSFNPPQDIYVAALEAWYGRELTIK